MNKRNLLIIILSVLIVLCVGVTVWAVFLRKSEEPPITPDYPPKESESNQIPIEGDETGKIDSPEGGGGIRVTWSTTATASLSNDTVSFYYANPGVSNQNVAILLTIGDLVVAKSDLIAPGHQVVELKLEAAAKAKLQVGGYNTVLTVRSYDPESNEKAMVNVTGDVTLTVVE